MKDFNNVVSFLVWLYAGSTAVDHFIL